MYVALIRLAVAVILAGAVGDRAYAQSDSLPPSCTFESIVRPPVERIVDHKVLPSGVFFVAGPKALFVRSPWGWSKVFDLPDGSDDISALGMIDNSGERLLVAAGNRLWVVNWTDSSDNAPQSSWPRIIRSFTPEEVQLPEALDIAAIKTVSDLGGALRGWLVDHNSGLAPLLIDGARLRVGAKVADGKSHSRHHWYPAPNGYGVAFAHAEPRFLVLKPDGTAADSYDLASQIRAVPGSPPPALRAAIVDPKRDLLFIGTTRGVFVADFDQVSGRVTSKFDRIRGLGADDVRYLDIVLGRLLVVGTQKFAKAAGGGLIAWESSDLHAFAGAASLARSMSFEPDASRPSPGGARAVIRVADDLVWVQDDEDTLWEWSASGWRVLRSETNKAIGDEDIEAIRDPLRRPLIVPALLDDRLARCIERDPFWRRLKVSPHGEFAEVIPDPEGIGVWVLSRPVSNNPREYAFPQFVTPHGVVDPLDHSSGFGFAVSRWRHVTSEGKTYWPESPKGGLILPIGDGALYAEGARWRMLDFGKKPAPQSLTDFTPGAQSSSTAWLALAVSNNDARVVRFDVSADKNRIETEVTATSCSKASAQKSNLVPDSSGHVWLACKDGDDLTLRRIHAITSEPDRTIHVGAFPDRPVWLVPTEMDSFLVGSRGMKRVGPAASLMANNVDGRTSPLLNSIPKNLSASLAKATWSEWFKPLSIQVRDVRPVPSSEQTALGIFTLLTANSDRSGIEPGPAFQINFGTEAPRPEPIHGENGKVNDRPLADVVVETMTEAGLRVWKSGASEPYGGHLEWVSRNNSQTHPLDEEPVAAARYLASEFRASNGRERDWLVVTTDRMAAFWLPPGDLFGKSIAAVVPTQLTIEYSDRASSTVYDLEHSSPPAELESNATRATLLFAPASDQWWLGLPKTEVRSSEAEPWQRLDSFGKWSFSLRPGLQYNLRFRTWDQQGAEPTGLKPAAFRVAPLPPPPLQWWLLVPAVLGVAVAVAAVGSVELRRRILILLGRRLRLVASDCTYKLAIGSENGAITMRLQHADSDYPISIPSPSRGEPLDNWAVDIRAKFAQSSTVLVDVASPELFLRPWASYLTGDLAGPDDLAVAGQVVPISAQMTVRETPQKHICFTPIGCDEAANGPGGIDAVEAHLSHLVSLLRHRFVRAADPISAAKVSDLLKALAEADIVHILAHAEPDRIFLADNDATAADIERAFADKVPRCRLLVLSACEANRFAEAGASFVAALVRRGVTVLGATKPIDAAVAECFFSAFYEDLIPRSNGDGATLAEAMRKGARSLVDLPNEHVWRADIDSLVLYGNPTLRLRFLSG